MNNVIQGKNFVNVYIIKNEKKILDQDDDPLDGVVVVPGVVGAKF
jgi:hypothetical protein